MIPKRSLSLSLSFFLFTSPAVAFAIPVFSDDFNDGNFLGWTAVDADGSPASWSVSGGELQGTGDQKNATNSGRHDSLLVADPLFGRDLTLDLDLRYISGVANPGDGFPSEQAYYVALRYTDPDNFIYLRINPVDNCSACGLGPDITIKEVVAGSVSFLDAAGIYPTGVPPANPSSVVSHLTVELADLRIVLSWDGSEVFNQFLPFVNRGNGHIGVGVPDGNSLITAGVSQFDNVAVQGTIVPEPSTSLLLSLGLWMLCIARVQDGRRPTRRCS